MKKRLLSFMFGTALLISTVCGCSSAEKETTDDVVEEDASVEEDAVAEEEAAAEESVADEKITLKIMHYFTEESEGADATAMRHSIDNFLADHPNVEIVQETITQAAGYEAKIKTLAAANELPDLFLALPSMMSTFDESGLVMDLSSVLAEDTQWSDSFAEGVFNDYTFDEKVLGVPRFAAVNHVMYWNEEIFAECGLDGFPENQEEFLEAVKSIREHGYTPIACGNKGKAILASQVMPGILFRYVSADWYTNLKNYNGASFTDPDAVAAMDYMQQLVEAGAFNEDLNSLEGAQGRELYYGEKAAMYIEGSWFVNLLITDGGEELVEKTNVTLFPAVTGKEDIANQMVTGQGWGFAVNSNLTDEKKALAIEFLKEVTSPEIQAEGVENGTLSVLKEVPYDESKLHPFYNEFVEMYDSYGVRVGCPEVQLSTAYMDASYTGYQELSIGSISAEELAQTLQDAHEQAN